MLRDQCLVNYLDEISVGGHYVACLKTKVGDEVLSRGIITKTIMSTISAGESQCAADGEDIYKVATGYV